jgi:hypothetical protein
VWASSIIRISICSHILIKLSFKATPIILLDPVCFIILICLQRIRFGSIPPRSLHDSLVLYLYFRRNKVTSMFNYLIDTIPIVVAFIRMFLTYNGPINLALHISVGVYFDPVNSISSFVRYIEVPILFAITTFFELNV